MKSALIFPASAALLVLALAVPNPSQARTVERTTAGTAKPLPSASITLDCGGVKYVLSVPDSSGGSCQTTPNPDGGAPKAAKCSGSDGSVAGANCSAGCSTFGSASCSTAQ